MAGSSKVAKRYARAVFEGSLPDSLEQTRDALAVFVKAFNENEELRLALKSPAIPMASRLAVVNEIANTVAPNNTTVANTVKLFIENGRISELEGAVESLTGMIEAWKKMRSIKVTSAFPLQQDERSEMLTQIQQMLGSSASVEWNVEPEIIGGLQVKAGDLLLDGSIKTSLEQIRASLLQ